MIEHIFTLGDLAIAIRIDGKKVSYRDTKHFLRETNMITILDGDRKDKFSKRLAELTSEKEIAEEIKEDMIKEGMKFVKTNDG